MFAVAGFEEAIIGTGVRYGSEEVLVYDAEIAQALLDEDEELGNYLYNIGIEHLGEEAPLFVFLNKKAVEEKSYGSRVVH